MSHKVIVIPGLGDNTRNIKLATKHYKKFGLEPIIHSIGWRKGKKHFKSKLQKLINLIDKLDKDGNRISLIGTSAGASAVMNAYVVRKNKIYKVISICGRLRVGPVNGFRSFDKMTKTSLSFKESVLMLEKSQSKLTKIDKKKIMTITALFDELVPPETSSINGTNNHKIKSVEHMFSIWMGLSFYKPLKDFLK